MIYYNDSDYRVTFYKEISGTRPTLEYIESLSGKEQTKILKYIEFLRIHKGVLDEPYSRHIEGKIRELRVDFARNRHRIFYFVFVNKNIIFLNAFLKKTEKTPVQEIEKAKVCCRAVMLKKETYE